MYYISEGGQLDIYNWAGLMKQYYYNIINDEVLYLHRRHTAMVESCCFSSKWGVLVSVCAVLLGQERSF